MDTTRICPETGALLTRGIRPVTLTHKGLSMTINMPGWYSDDQSAEGIHSGEDMKISDRALNLLKARSGGLLEPAEIRRIRKELGLTQAEAGTLIGGGPQAFQKYEAGDLLPSKAVCNLLRVLAQFPDALQTLREAPMLQAN